MSENQHVETHGQATELSEDMAEKTDVVSDGTESDVSEFAKRTLQLESELEALKEECKAEQGRALRAMADFENFRKRKENEVEQFKQYANEKLIVEFLPVIDSFDRAFEQAGTEQSPELMAGFQLIHKQFLSILDKLGVSPFDSLNQPFDPNV
ncbi:nucleotide exchange factor GrpE, partial [bacterium]|nr:nucleotide exchange factor GrpE [bacterium]